MSETYDVLGVGFGPANIALAAAFADVAEAQGRDGLPLNALFVERQPTSAWQSGTLLEGTDIQHHYLRDLAMPRNPRSRFTFPYYLWTKGRFYKFTGLGGLSPSRIELADYIQWVAGHFTDSVRYDTEARAVRASDSDQDGLVVDLANSDGGVTSVRARCVVLATGQRAAVPALFEPFLGDRVFHTSVFLERIEAFDRQAPLRVAVVGGAQSAGEIMLFLLNVFPRATVYSIVRSFGYRLVDLSHFLNEINSPEFVDYHYELDPDSREELLRDTWYTNYSVIDADVSRALYWRHYEDLVLGRQRFHLLRLSEVVECDAASGTIGLVIQDRHTKRRTSLTADVVVVATGYREELMPTLLRPLAPCLEADARGGVLVTRDYRLRTRKDPGGVVYLNGLAERSHGISHSTSFSMMALKAGELCQSILAHCSGWRRGAAVSPVADAVEHV